MAAERTRTLSGLLLDASTGTIEREDLLACQRLKFSSLVGKTGWEIYSYHSPEPLRGEEPEAGAFIYLVVCRRSGSRLLVLGSGREIVPYLLERELNLMFSPQLRRVQIGIDPLVKAITKIPGEYVLSFAHARVPAYGANLRSVSFYGDDLANARFFKDHIELMTFFTCGLRHAVGGAEIVRLSTDGAISFIFTDAERVREVERVLHFLRTEGYLDSENGRDHAKD
jgi:hypothetical protein